MKKTLSLLTILLVVISCLVIASAQSKKRKTIIGGAAGTGARMRNGSRGRYVTRNGKRIWVPQGSPAIGNRRGVVEREQLEAVRKN